MAAPESVSVFASLQLQADVVLPAANVPSEDTEDRTVNVNDFGLDAVLDADNTPTPTEIYSQELTIGAGTTTIDLTSCVTVAQPGGSVDLTGKNLQAWQFETPSTNSGDVTIKPGATNPYDLFGAAMTGGIKVPPHSNLIGVCQSSSLEDVSATEAEIDVSGTATDVFRIKLIFE